MEREGGRYFPFRGATVPIKLGVSAKHLNKSYGICTAVVVELRGPLC